MISVGERKKVLSTNEDRKKNNLLSAGAAAQSFDRVTDFRLYFTITQNNIFLSKRELASQSRRVFCCQISLAAAPLSHP